MKVKAIIKKIEFDEAIRDNLEACCKQVINEAKLQKIPKFANTYMNLIITEYYDRYVIIKNEIFKFNELKILSYGKGSGEDIFLSTSNDNGTISFVADFNHTCINLNEFLNLYLGDKYNEE